MAKMQSGMAGLREIPLSQIVDNGNVRVDYKEIEELAESIKANGQLEPVLVKLMEKDADGIDNYELIVGHRRLRAVQYLCDKGESFTTIKALIVTGDKLTLQLVENLQRSDLTAAERESGIYAMCKNGLSQKEVAARLAKPETFISRNVSAHKVREAARAAGIDTSELATGTLNEIQAAAAPDYAGLVTEILQEGGTLEVARFVMENYRVGHGKPAKPQKEKEQDPPLAAPEEKNAGGLSKPLGLDPLSADNIVDDGQTDYTHDDNRAETPPEKPEKERTAVLPKGWIEEFNPPHKQVDFNNICLSIIHYAEEQKIEKCPVYIENRECELCPGRHFCEAYYKIEAAKDIMSLLHIEL